MKKMSTVKYNYLEKQSMPLQQLFNVLSAKRYSPRAIRNYAQEMRFIFAHYYDVLPASISNKDIIDYINHIIKAYEVGREKCHQVAQSYSFSFKHVMPSPFIVPSQFYPRKEHKLPQVFSAEQAQNFCQ